MAALADVNAVHSVSICLARFNGAGSAGSAFDARPGAGGSGGGDTAVGVPAAAVAA